MSIVPLKVLMAPRGKIVRSTAAQITRLVDYMSTNALFACGEFAGPLGAQRMEAEWAQLKTLLAENGPDKTVDQWKHTWRDLKKKAREEAGRARLAHGKTGNAVPIPDLSENTKKILQAIGVECATGIGVESETAIGVVSTDTDPVEPTSSLAFAENLDLDFQFQPVEAEIEFFENFEVPELPRRPRSRAPYPGPHMPGAGTGPGASAGPSRPGPSAAARAGRRAGRRRTASQDHSAAFVRGQNITNRILQDIAVELRMIRRQGARRRP